MRNKLIWLTMAATAAVPGFGSPVVNLGSATTFGLIGGTAVSNTGTSVVTGNVGVGSGAGTITGFNPTGTTVSGSVISPGSALSNNAYADFVNAFNTSVGLASTQSYSDLSVNRTFIGNNVYTFTTPSVTTTTGITLTFDAQNDPNAVFVVRTDAAFTANGALNFTLQNQAKSTNIFWIVGTNATLSPASSGPMTFDGNILAGGSFTMSAQSGGSGALAGTINGCVYSESVSTLAGTTNIGGCKVSNAPASVPEPGSSALVGLGCLMGIVAWRKRRQIGVR
jgi:hypothetical protein